MGSSRLKSRRRQDQGYKWSRIAIAFLSTVGVIDTASITLSRWGWISTLSCPGGNEGCNKVLNSSWGTVFQLNGLDIPLSFVGFLSYLGIVIMAIVPFLPGLSDQKTELTKKTWWGIFATSCSMSVFSLLLIGLMIFKIKAFCLFCILSAIISLSLLILSWIGGGWEERGELLFRGFMISLGIVLGGLIWASNVDPSKPEIVVNSPGAPPLVKAKSTSSEIALAKHLKKIGAVMYSAYWCPHCHDQKEMFGKEAVKELVIIECAEDGQNNQASLCNRKGITGFPSWEINNKIDSGVKTLAELSELSGYK